MFQAARNRNIRHAVMLLGNLAMHFIALVHSLPTVDGDVLTMVERRAVAEPLALGPQQDIPDGLAQFPEGPLNQFLRIISTLPPGEKALDAVGKILTPLQQLLATSAGLDTTRDDMTQNAPCADVTVIFARGTTEPGNVGLIAGPPFLDALSEQLGGKSLVVQGVEYPATFAGFNQNGTNGVPSMTDFIEQAATNCPNTKIVMSGYSQGALVVRSTANTLPAGIMAKINSVLTFGDPGNPDPITGADGKAMIICQEDDSVCSGGFINIAHLTYGANATAAAQFVVQRANSEWGTGFQMSAIADLTFFNQHNWSRLPSKV